MKKLLIRTVIISCCAASAPAVAKGVTCRGEVKTGTLDSAVGDCSFLSKGKEASKIFKVCKMDDQCEVTANVRDGNWITKVISVKLIKKAP